MSVVSNWGGNLRFRPDQLLKPANSQEIMSIVKDAITTGKKIRTIGSGHSWTGLIATDQILVSLDNYKGILRTDDPNSVIVKSGTKIKELGELLAANQLGLENLGDIDVQSIAGAISTGTHGTGINFGSIATQIVEMKIINGHGDEVTCSDTINPHIFKAAQVSLGALGIITEMKFRCLPAYKLYYQAKKENLHEVMQKLERTNSENRNFEFYWFPYSNIVQTKYSNATDKEVIEPGFGNFINDIVIENGLLKVVSEIVKIFPSLAPAVSKLSAKAVSDSTRLNWSHKVYATTRMVKFSEMEYNIPITCFKDVVLEVAELVERKRFKTNFPTENRFVQADDIYLSPAYNRTSAYIAAHVYKGMEYKAYFDALESVFINNNGRPHWGKMHTRKHDYLSNVYPRWNDFLSIREMMDPKCIFINDHLKDLLGI